MADETPEQKVDDASIDATDKPANKSEVPVSHVVPEVPNLVRLLLCVLSDVVLVPQRVDSCGKVVALRARAASL